MEQKTEFMVAGTDKVFAIHVGNIQSDEEIYGSLLDKLFTTYKAKDADYGSAFAEMFDELGIDYAPSRSQCSPHQVQQRHYNPRQKPLSGI